MVPTDPDTGPVDRSRPGQGLRGRQGPIRDPVTDEEIRSVRLESTKIIDIERFVDEAEIDRIYWNDPYFLAPDGKLAAEAFAVIREAMADVGPASRSAGWCMHTRERLLALEPRGGASSPTPFAPQTRCASRSQIFAEIPEAKADKNMVEIAPRSSSSSPARSSPRTSRTATRRR